MIIQHNDITSFLKTIKIIINRYFAMKKNFCDDEHLIILATGMWSKTVYVIDLVYQMSVNLVSVNLTSSRLSS